MKIPAATPLEEVPWVPRNRLTPLARLGLVRICDLLTHYPRRHEDRTRFERFPDGETETAVCLCGEVTRTSLKRFRGGGKCFEAYLESEGDGILSPILISRWFNAHYVQKMIASGLRMVVYGKTKLRKGQLTMDHPEFEIIEEDAELSIHFGRITPIHPAGEGITTKALRMLIHRALAETDPSSVTSLLPIHAEGATTHDRFRALSSLHFPASREELELARPQLAFEELFGLQAILVSRRESARRQPGSAKITPGDYLQKLRDQLPFTLTPGQETVLSEIRKDIESPEPMQRLLQGDVGSGKTVVALGAALQVIEAGWQAALMAPTQILADQHFQNFRALLEPLRLRVSLQTGARKESAEGLPLFGESEAPHLIVGTHALLYDSAELPKLGLVIIDEQHKFGVMQRARLLQRGLAPDLLVLTATPIPRTLTQTIYGDLDVSVLREKPAGRQKILTAVRPEAKLPEITNFLRTKLEEGRQAYIVYPLIDESDKLQAKAATEEGEKWAGALSPYKMELLHGRIPVEEKEQIMNRFRGGTTDVLVATTVIEVGVDVPNATIMLVENAERFGLAQLHQLRGRVGRGTHKSYCILVYGKKADGAAEKLAVLESSEDGFAIAEADLRFRGPGDLIGTAQTGLPPLRIADLLRDAELMTKARESVRKILLADPELTAKEHLPLSEFLQSCQRRMLAASG